MPRFKGTPVEDPQRKPRFGGTPMPEGGPTQDNADIVAGGPTRDNAQVSTHNPQYLRDQYNQMPWYQKIPQALDDTARYGTDTATFGGADWLASKLPGGGTLDDERQKTEDARARSTGAATALDIAQIAKAPQLLARGKLGATGLKAIPGILGMGADAGLYTGAQSLGHGADYGDAAADAMKGAAGAVALGSILPGVRGAASIARDTSPLGSGRLANVSRFAHAAHIAAHPFTGLPGLAAHMATGGAGSLTAAALRSRMGQGAQTAMMGAGRSVPAWFDYYTGEQ